MVTAVDGDAADPGASADTEVPSPFFFEVARCATGGDGPDPRRWYRRGCCRRRRWWVGCAAWSVRPTVRSMMLSAPAPQHNWRD
ncbi:uvrD/Rep family helicase [Mycobacterium xenopi 3993]|nr:uvrD/Rep family helicase [Mycobacterium xenopi 3993]